MSIPPPDERLSILSGNLRRRIEDGHPDEELSATAVDLKRLLLHRIANIEAAMKNLNEIIAKSSAPKDSIDTTQLNKNL